jgi:hypothetical protein
MEFKEGDWVIVEGYYSADWNGATCIIIHKFSYAGNQMQIEAFRDKDNKPFHRITTIDVKYLKPSPMEVDAAELIDMALALKDREWFEELSKRVGERK